MRSRATFNRECWGTYVSGWALAGALYLAALLNLLCYMEGWVTFVLTLLSSTHLLCLLSLKLSTLVMRQLYNGGLQFNRLVLRQLVSNRVGPILGLERVLGH